MLYLHDFLPEGASGERKPREIRCYLSSKFSAVYLEDCAKRASGAHTGLVPMCFGEKYHRDGGLKESLLRGGGPVGGGGGDTTSDIGTAGFGEEDAHTADRLFCDRKFFEVDLCWMEEQLEGVGANAISLLAESSAIQEVHIDVVVGLSPNEDELKQGDGVAPLRPAVVDDRVSPGFSWGGGKQGTLPNELQFPVLLPAEEMNVARQSGPLLGAGAGRS